MYIIIWYVIYINLYAYTRIYTVIFIETFWNAKNLEII